MHVLKCVAWSVRSFSQSPMSQSEQVTDEQTAANKFLQSLPGQDKTYSFLIGTSAATYLFAHEIIPLTAEVAYLLPFGIVVNLAFKHVGPMLSEVVGKVDQERTKFWLESKSKAEQRLHEQIHDITGSGITDLVDVTKDLFDHAEEVAKLESKAYEHEQKLEVYAKAKQILDEWVRFEANERERVQKLIAADVIAKVTESLKDPKFQEKYLEQCIGDIEIALTK